MHAVQTLGGTGTDSRHSRDAGRERERYEKRRETSPRRAFPCSLRSTTARGLLSCEPHPTHPVCMYRMWDRSVPPMEPRSRRVAY